MPISHHKDRQEYAAKSFAIAKEYFPEHADPARELVIEYLSRYDRERMLRYTGELADKDYDACNMDTAHYMISSLLYERDNGNPNVTEQVIDIQARVYLELPFAVIEGDQP